MAGSSSMQTMEVRDRRGQAIHEGQRVRIVEEPVQEGEVRRLVSRYAVLTVIVDAKAGKAERMVRAGDVEVVAATA
jgi:hypothetical protein